MAFPKFLVLHHYAMILIPIAMAQGLDGLVPFRDSRDSKVAVLVLLLDGYIDFLVYHRILLRRHKSRFDFNAGQ